MSVYTLAGAVLVAAASAAGAGVWRVARFMVRTRRKAPRLQHPEELLHGGRQG